MGVRPALTPDAQKAMQKQIRKAFEPLLQAELSFINRVAKPSDEERRSLIAAAVKWLDEFVGEFVKQQEQNDLQMWMQGMQRVEIGGRRNKLDPRESIQHGLAKLVVEILPADKAAACQLQATKRADFYRDAIVANLVVQLDDKLTLASEQRQNISASLTEHWDEKWPPQIESFAYGSNYFLTSPQEAVRPELSESQQIVFDQLNSSSQQIMFHAMLNGGHEKDVIDDIDLDERPAAAEKPPVTEHAVVGNADQITN